MSKRVLLLRHVWLQATLWIGIAVVVNHLAAHAYLRIDVTADQRFSLSQVARDAVSSLDKPLVLTVWFTEDLDPPYHNHRSHLEDKLSELITRAGGRLQVQWRDPTGDEATIAEARATGVQPVTYTFRRWDRQEARQVWMSASLVYGDRQTVADGLVSVGRMEYDLVRAIRAVTKPPEERKTVAWLLGDGEPDLGTFPPTDPLGRLRDQLRQQWTVATIAPGAEGIPEEVDAVLVVGPQQAVSSLTQLALDQHLMRGGGIAWFLSQTQPDFQNMGVREVRHGLHAQVGHYGVKLGRDTLLDRASNERMMMPIPVGGQRVVAQINHPAAVVTTTVDRTFGPVRDVRRVVLPFASSLALTDPLPSQITPEVWVQTADSTVSVHGLAKLDPQVLSSPIADEVPGPFPAMIALSGRFRSYFSARPLPEGAPVEMVTDGQPARMIVVGSGDMVANNAPLVENALDWLVEDVELIGIRTRGGEEAPLEAPPQKRAAMLKALILLGPLFLLAIIGLWTSGRGRKA